ncbi:MAG TPA: LysM peptidoglycan-binding domain-containing protein [Cyclobacteriaceae bacterium]|nr:LysM peptidoglycan-binding domain-containing protein [Cyclobacteriaceae bacterium]
MRFFATTLFICGVVASTAPTASGQGQTPTVPHRLPFAGMTLIIREDAREEIQKDVNLLTQSPKYFEVKAERARTYFPIIERIFAEERVPEDFKFLVLQESALIADAVSVSNAVGFWQFKDFTAREMGLRVDNEVDERMNIVSSTRGAAKYIKQNNFMFNNWVYALQSYQMGAGGVRRVVGDDVNGSRHMEITSDTYWYVKKFLAHKIAFQDAVETEPRVKVTEIVISEGGSLESLSSNMSMDIAGLREFNKWIRADALPSDRQYTLIVPAGSVGPEFSTLYTASNNNIPPVQPKEVVKSEDEILINEVPVVQANPGETLTALATRAGLSTSQFVRYNDLDDNHRVNAGGYYFKAKKKSKTEQDYHKVKQGETLWQISQLYGVQIKRLKKYNHLDENVRLAAGNMIWLNSNKPKDGDTPDEDEPALELMEDKVFDWGTPSKKSDEVPIMNEESSVGMILSPAVPDVETHIVQAGETLYSISKQHQLSVNDLKLMNDIDSEGDIKPGQVLKVTVNENVDAVPAAEPLVSANGVFHDVKLSDTLYSVARQYGVTIKDLMECNNKKDFSVSLGERLKIPSK